MLAQRAIIWIRIVDEIRREPLEIEIARGRTRIVGREANAVGEHVHAWRSQWKRVGLVKQYRYAFRSLTRPLRDIYQDLETAKLKETSVKLYGYFRSSAAYRVRIALNLKKLHYEQSAVHLTRNGGWQWSEEFRAINPQRRVPALALSTGEILLQSLAIIEYLDEVEPEPRLLPADAI